LDLLPRDGWDIREFRLLKRTRRRNFACINEACLDCGPVDSAHKSGDMGGRVGAVLHVVRALVHAGRQYRDGGGDALRMIGGTLIEQAAIPRHVA
jgi:hypothetical protein